MVSDFFCFFLAGRLEEDESESKSESEVDSEENDAPGAALRFNLFTRPATVGFTVEAFPATSFSSSASLSEVEVDDDPEVDPAAPAFFADFNFAPVFDFEE